MHALWQPWLQGFMQRALLELLLVGAVGAVLGAWVVVYELSFSTESLAHAMFPGLVGAALLGLPLVAGGAAGVLAGSLAVALAGRIPALGRDAAVAVVVTTLFGLGVLFALNAASPPGLDNLLFGDLLGVGAGDLWTAGGLAAATLATLAPLHRPLLALGFDRSVAPALGLRPLALDAALLAVVAAAVVVGVQGLGNLLVLAVLVAPAATARLLARRLPQLMALAALAAAAAALGGLYLSYYADVAAGAAVSIVAVGLYLGALGATRLRQAIS
ncbi:MAG: metal ABC transporter permease [Gaiellaceae bacterium]